MSTSLTEDPADVAQAAGLRYVSDDEPGYRRKRWGRGFTYLDLAGQHIQDDALREQLDALVIPPAWTEVWICPDPEGHIQVTGRDAEGRKQYIYHSRWAEIRSQAKFNRLLAFGKALPLIRAKVDENLRRHRFPREKVVALVVRFLDEALIRIGNSYYARKNESYGLTTLQNHHLEVSGCTLHFSFRGKSGKQQEIGLRDRRLARIVKGCQELPGQELFQYIDDEDQVPRPLDSRDVNDFLQEVTGQRFTAKDFRTWGGTVTAVADLYELGPSSSETETKKNLAAAVKGVAEALGNTPTVCRQHYIHPIIFDAYTDGYLFKAMKRAEKKVEDSPYALNASEQATMTILRKYVRDERRTTNDGRA